MEPSDCARTLEEMEYGLGVVHRVSPMRFAVGALVMIEVVLHANLYIPSQNASMTPSGLRYPDLKKNEHRLHLSVY